VKAILGRLSDLGVKELFKLLTSAGASGELELESGGSRATLRVRSGHVAGEPSAAILHALAARNGTYCFRPGSVADEAEWFGIEEFLARLDALQAPGDAGGADLSAADGASDPLAELRHSLAEVPLPNAGPRVLVISADPRPYRALEPEWRKRGWDTTVRSEPTWVDGIGPSVAVLHLPTSATLAGLGDVWLDLVRRAGAQSPPVPVIWVGGLTDPLLRHQAIHAGAEFLLPAPVGDVGEAARWFREDVTVVAERAIARGESGAQREAAAFRDFFLALHSDAAPAEVRASLLRFAGNFFTRAALLAVRDDGFDSLGGFGFHGAAPGRLPRGLAALERVVADRRPLRSSDLAPEELSSLAAPLRLDAAGSRAVGVFPLLSGSECAAILVAHEPLPDVVETASLASLLGRSGSLLGL
jgi:hypothetical protein